MYSVKSNIHTHTNFSDGKNTVEENILSAISLGMNTLGFSDHSYTAPDVSYCMKKEKISEYITTVNEMKEKYKDKISILCGIEYDTLSDIEVTNGLDYYIGACHYAESNGVYYPVDHCAEVTKQAINEGFGGNQNAYAENYFENLIKCLKYSPVYIAHFDLIVKHRVIDETDKRYRNLALSVLDEILAKNIPVEINTGAMSRGLKDVIYPADFILKHIKEKGGKIIMGSDCHNKENLLFAFDTAGERLLADGINSILVFENGKLCEKGLI